MEDGIDIKYKRVIRGNGLSPRKDYPVGPDDINTVCIGDVFGSFETEEVCRTIVKFCQNRKEGWAPFALEEIGVSAGHVGFVDLVHRGLVVEFVKDESYIVSHTFVAYLFGNAPAFHLTESHQPEGD